MSEFELNIEYVDPCELKAYGNNAKLHPKEQIEQIKESIRQFGFRDPIGLWHGEIVEGHGRQIAAVEMGLDRVPVIRLDDMTDEQRRAYMLVHNQTTMNSGWDEGLLELELDNIFDIDMSAFGFSDEDVYEEDEDEEKEANPVDVLPDSRVLVSSISAFGTKSECFVEVRIDEEEAERLLEKIKEVTPERAGAAIMEALRDL